MTKQESETMSNWANKNNKEKQCTYYSQHEQGNDYSILLISTVLEQYGYRVLKRFMTVGEIKEYVEKS